MASPSTQRSKPPGRNLKNRQAGQRHIVLFADAADAEEPGEFRDLLARITAAGGTVSVIGLGTPQDPDARLLRKSARWVEDASFSARTPRSFRASSRETVAVARSAFLTEPVAVLDAGGWPEIGAAPIALPARVDAYNLSYLKPQAAALAVTGDEYRAWSRSGSGRRARCRDLFPVAGEYSSTIQSWVGASDFGDDCPLASALGSITRNLAADERDGRGTARRAAPRFNVDAATGRKPCPAYRCFRAGRRTV